MASSNTPEIVVLHRLIHRADPEDLADEIEKRLPNATIHTATSAAESAEYIQTADIAVGAFHRTAPLKCRTVILVSNR